MIIKTISWVAATVVAAVIGVALTVYLTREVFDGMFDTAAGWWESTGVFLVAHSLPNWVVFLVLLFLLWTSTLFWSENSRAGHLEKQLEEAIAPEPEEQPPEFQPSDRQVEVIKVFLREQNPDQHLSAKTISARLGVSPHEALHHLDVLHGAGWLSDSFNTMTGRSFRLSRLGRANNLHLLLE